MRAAAGWSETVPKSTMALTQVKHVCRVLLLRGFLPGKGGGITRTRTTQSESESGAEKLKHKMNKTCSPNAMLPLQWGGVHAKQSANVSACASLWCDSCTGCCVRRLRAATGHRQVRQLHEAIPSTYEGDFPPAYSCAGGLQLISSGRLSP